MSFNISDKLLALMKEKDFSYADLEKLTSYSRSTLQRYFTGTTEKIPLDLIEELAPIFNVSATYLAGWEDDGNSDIPNHPDIIPITKKRFPLIGGVACGEPIYREEDFESYIEAGTDIKADFAMRCHGNSMINIGIKDGFIVFIRKQPKVENGEVAAVNIDGEYTLKRFYNYGNIILLRAENPDFEDIELKEGDVNNITILGKAVAFQGDVK